MSSITLSIVGGRGVTVDIGPSSSARGCSAARVWPVRYQRGTVQAWP